MDSCLAVNKHVKFLPRASPQEHGVWEHHFARAFVVSVRLTKEFRSIDPIDLSHPGSGNAPCTSDCMSSCNPPKNPEGWLYQQEILQVENGSAVNCQPSCHCLVEAQGGFKLHRLLLQLFCMHGCMLRASVVADSLWPHGLKPARLLCAGHSPGKKTGVGCCALFFPTQGSNMHLAGRFFTTGATVLVHCNSGFSFSAKTWDVNSDVFSPLKME